MFSIIIQVLGYGVLAILGLAILGALYELLNAFLAWTSTQ